MARSWKIIHDHGLFDALLLLSWKITDGGPWRDNLGKHAFHTVKVEKFQPFIQPNLQILQIMNETQKIE